MNEAERPGLWPPLAAFLLTAAILVPVQAAAPVRMLLADRLAPGAGWLEIPVVALYAAFVVRRMRDPRLQPRWRLRIWLLFSAAFFAQLGLGLAGLEIFLMNPERLHFPIPALIVAGPLYRDGGLFMPILFGATLLLVGPAWCSHLCYLGSWDGAAAAARKKPLALPHAAAWLRAGLLAGVAATAVLLRWLSAPPLVAGGLALGFGLAGVAVMLLISRRRGSMIHCTAYCPIGLVADLVGKISPFRLRLREGCTDCGACAVACRYGALREEDIRRRRPGLTCTLCGDCVGRCRTREIEYRFPGLGAAAARTVFQVLVVSLHACFLALAMI